ncbi:MAG TPA: HEAT repeat domain-containing protein [Planctomycetota bacterium]|jgi:HEAT repeat protein
MVRAFLHYLSCIVVALACSLQAEQPAQEPIDIAIAFSGLSAKEVSAQVTAAKTLLQGLNEEVQKSTKPYLKKLTQDLNSAEAATRETAAKSLSAITEDLRKGAGKDLSELLAQSGVSDEKKRTEARTRLVEVLNHACEISLVDTLIDDLAATDAATVAAAVQKLKEIGADAASPLANALDDERVAVKKNAADILKAMGPAAKGAASDLAFMLDSEDKGTRRLVAGILENLGPDAAEVADDMVRYLDNDERTVRRNAANILKKMGPAAKETASDLAQLLDNDDKNVRALAAEVLISLGPNAKDAAKDLADLIDAPDQNEPDIRERAANVLAAIGPEAKSALDVLKKRAEDSNAAVKTAIDQAIKAINK